MRFLAIDLGDKRTGIAVGDSVTGLVSPLEVLELPAAVRGGEELLAGIERVARQQLGDLPAAGPVPGRGQPGGVVVGLPVNMDGTEGPHARRTREFGARIGQRLGLTVHFQDERLTSSDADWSMARSGLTRGQKKKKRDALAAAAILRDFLGAMDPPGQPRSGHAEPDSTRRGETDSGSQ